MGTWQGEVLGQGGSREAHLGTGFDVPAHADAAHVQLQCPNVLKLYMLTPLLQHARFGVLGAPTMLSPLPTALDSQ
jgi:hypothetical protein